MKNQKQKEYETPQTTFVEVELEQGFMKASVFDPEDGHDKGVSIEGHAFGNSGNYFDGTAPTESGLSNDEWNSWDN